MIKVESIIRIVVEGSSGMTSIEDSFSDRLVITPSEINYTSDPHGIHDTEAVSKWSYKTNSQAFEALYKQLAEKISDMLNLGDMLFVMDGGSVNFTVTYSDRRKKSVRYSDLDGSYRDCFELIRQMVPSSEALPLVISHCCEIPEE